MLKLKQDILTQSERIDSANSKKVLNSQQPAAQFSWKSKPYRFFNMIGDKIDKYWKTGIHRLSVLQEILAKPFNDQAFNLLRGLSQLADFSQICMVWPNSIQK